MTGAQIRAEVVWARAPELFSISCCVFYLSFAYAHTHARTFYNRDFALFTKGPQVICNLTVGRSNNVKNCHLKNFSFRIVRHLFESSSNTNTTPLLPHMSSCVCVCVCVFRELVVRRTHTNQVESDIYLTALTVALYITRNTYSIKLYAPQSKSLMGDDTFSRSCSHSVATKKHCRLCAR